MGNQHEHKTDRQAARGQGVEAQADSLYRNACLSATYEPPAQRGVYVWGALRDSINT